MTGRGSKTKRSRRVFVWMDALDRFPKAGVGLDVRSGDLSIDEARRLARSIIQAASRAAQQLAAMKRRHRAGFRGPQRYPDWAEAIRQRRLK